MTKICRVKCLHFCHKNYPKRCRAMSDRESDPITVAADHRKQQRLGEGADEKSRFRPPITPSNSLRLRSPPVIMITDSPSLHLPKHEQQVVSSPFNFNGNGSSSASSPSAGCGTSATRINHPPQPFPVPLQRRRSSCSSSAGSPLASGGFHPRYSAPRLSITSLGSAAKTFRNIAAFIVPEEEGERERARDRLRKRALLREGRAMTETAPERRRGSGRVFEFFPGLKVAEMGPISKMHSSTAVPRPPPPPLRSLSQQKQQKQQSNAMGKQRNGAVPQQRTTAIKGGAREGSRSRNTDALGAQKVNGHSPRAPSVPATTNRRYAHVKSKVGSITDYTPSPSQVKIFHAPVRVSAVPKVGSLQNACHVPAGGNVKIENRKLNFREAAKPRVEDKSDVPVPKSEKKIATQKLEWKAQSKVGSLENAKHKPAGGTVKIFNQTVRVKSESKVGSLDNIGHVPGGGTVKISDYARSISGSGGSRRDTFDSGRSSSSADAPKPTRIVLSPQRSPRPVEMLLTPKEVPPMSPTEEDEQRQQQQGEQYTNNKRVENGEETEEADDGGETTPRGKHQNDVSHNGAQTAQLISFGD